MNWTVLISVLVGAMLGAGIVLVFVPRKVTYRGVSLEKHNQLVGHYNILDGDLVELRRELIELDERFLGHSHQPEPIQTRREVTGYISAASDYDEDDHPTRRRTSRNLNPDPRIRRSSQGRSDY